MAFALTPDGGSISSLASFVAFATAVRMADYRRLVANSRATVVVVLVIGLTIVRGTVVTMDFAQLGLFGRDD